MKMKLYVVTSHTGRFGYREATPKEIFEAALAIKLEDLGDATTVLQPEITLRTVAHTVQMVEDALHGRVRPELPKDR